MTEMNNIVEETMTTVAGNYKIITCYKEAPKEKYLRFEGRLIKSDGHICDGPYYKGWLYGASYAITDEGSHDERGVVVIRRIYGTAPKGKYLEGKNLQKVYDENAAAISAAAADWCKNSTAMDFLWELHRVINQNAGEVLGREAIPYGTYRSQWAGDDMHLLFCKPVLTEGRVSAPLRLDAWWSCGKGNIDLWLDNEHPAADIRKLTGCHRYTSAVAYRRSDDRGIDLGNSRWPKGLPESAEVFGKLIDLYGSACWDSINFTQQLSGEDILRAVARS